MVAGDFAADALRAVDEGLVEIRDGREIVWPHCGARPLLIDQGERKSTPRRISVRVEDVLTLAALYELVERRGWPRDHVWLEPKIGRGWPLDLAVRQGPGPAAQMVIAAEAKSSDALANKLVTEVRECGARGEHDEGACGKRNSHRKYRALVAESPCVFLVLSPTCRRAYSVRKGTRAGELELVERDGIPTGGRGLATNPVTPATKSASSPPDHPMQCSLGEPSRRRR